jgi:predicted AAA+ superfamily ATPase
LVLRKNQKDIFYFNETGQECDFIVFSNNKAEEIIQVCHMLDPNNRSGKNRDVAAMEFLI